MEPRGRSAKVRCPGCTLRPDLCLCAELPSLDNRTPVTVVMHVTERSRPSGTAQLLGRCLRDYRQCVVGDRSAPFRELPPADPDAPAYLLFPDSGGLELTPQSRARLPARISLVVPDGTWSQARRLFQRNPALFRLPRLQLGQSPATAYALRRNQRPGGLCTAEAVAVALGVLEDPAFEPALRRAVAEFSRRTLIGRHRGGWSRGPAGGIRPPSS